MQTINPFLTMLRFAQLAVFGISSLCFIACNQESNDLARTPSCEAITLVAPLDSIGTPDKVASIDSAAVDGQYLYLRGRYGGGCVADDLMAVAAVSPLAIFPPIINISMYDRATDLCEALETGRACFDISELRRQYPEATLQFNGSVEAIDLLP